MTDKQTPPDRLERIHLANLTDGRADCRVTGRWMRLPGATMETRNGALTYALMIVEVMVGGEERKLCELVMSREDLLMILNRMPVVPLGTPLPPCHGGV